MEQKQENSQENLPGYPHYPASDDITNKGEDINEPAEDQFIPEETAAVTAPEVADEQDAESDVTEDDIRMLSAADQNRDLEDADPEESVLDSRDDDGDLLNEISATYGEQGADLDVPGSEEDDASEAIGSEDEENNYYSLGGDNHNDLEDDTSV